MHGSVMQYQGSVASKQARERVPVGQKQARGVHVHLAQPQAEMARMDRGPRTCVCDSTTLLICFERRGFRHRSVSFTLGVVNALHLADEAVVTLGRTCRANSDLTVF
jgi:hypothetical protein